MCLLTYGLSSHYDAHVRAAGNSDRSPRSRKGARSAIEMQSYWLDKLMANAHLAPHTTSKHAHAHYSDQSPSRAPRA